MKRENSIDIVRGIVMIIMALDHVRDLMHINAITQNPNVLDMYYNSSSESIVLWSLVRTTEIWYHIRIIAKFIRKF